MSVSRQELMGELWRLQMEIRQHTQAANRLAERARELAFQVEQLRDDEGARVYATDCPPVIPERLEPETNPEGPQG